MNVNSVVLVGRLTRDPELRFLTNGMAVCQMTVAVSRKWKDKEHVVFVDVSSWGKTAELAKEYLFKGSLAAVAGELRQDNWQDKEGHKRTKLYVNADTIQFGPRSGGGGGQQSGPRPQRDRQQEPEPGDLLEPATDEAGKFDDPQDEPDWARGV